MNMIDVQDKLKGLSEDQLVREMQAPTGVAPQFLVLSEITRRKRMRDSFQNQEAQPTTTIAEEAVASAGVPQQGLGAMAQALAPNSSMAQNTAAMPQQAMPQAEPVQGMYGGGYVRKMADGGIASLMANPATRAYAEKEAQRLGLTLEQYLQTAGSAPITNPFLTQFADRQADRNRMLGLEPVGDSITMPTQSDLDRRFAEDKYGINTRPMQPPAADTMPRIPSMDSPVDLDLTAPSLPPLTARPDARPAVDTASPTDLLLDQQEYGFEPYSDQPMTAAELLSLSAGPSKPLPVRPEGGGVLPSGMKLDDYSAPGKYGNPEAGYARSYTEDSVFDPITGVQISGGVEGDVPDQNSTGSWFQDFILSDEAKRQVNDINARVAAAKGDAVNVQTAGPDTPRPKARPDGGVDDQGGVTTSDTGVVTGGDGGSGGNGGTGQSGGALGAGIGGASGTGSSYEQELRDAMLRAEKRANQDKWLALAQVGLNLMASKQPTLGGAIGEAGIGGLEAFRGARDAYENERLGLSKSLFDIQQQREAAMAAQRAASARATGRPLTPEQRLKQIEDRLSFLVQDDGMGGKVIMEGMDGVVASLRKEYSDILSGGGSGTFDATAQ